MTSSLLVVTVALVCAFAAVQAASLGGEDVCDPHSYAVRLTLSRHSAQIKNFKYCSGVRLNEHWLLTAAECFDNLEHKFVRLAAPDHCVIKEKHYEIERNDLTRRDRLVIQIHPSYNKKSIVKAYNLALVRSDFTLKDKTTVLLPYLKDVDTSYLSQNATIYTYDTVKFTSDKRITKLNATIVPQFYCAPGLPPHSEDKKYLCATVTGSKVITKDDLGAPLVFQATRFTTKKLLGVVTSVNDYTDQSFPVLFTRVYEHLSWISQVTNIKILRDAEDK